MKLVSLTIFFSLSGSYADELDSRIGSMTIADVSPRVAVKRIILLYENFQYREAANFINRLSHGTFKVGVSLKNLFFI